MEVAHKLREPGDIRLLHGDIDEKRLDLIGIWAEGIHGGRHVHKASWTRFATSGETEEDEKPLSGIG
ncbi:hypothetical protein MAE02_53880 [Microvirga aerophila]|uniref:Uncharacterized protein n=1 Tax=Microvirga aerophila TaxID=670291 RepID=A0A512C0G0_9HYPH|nr:hypothetical protein MAE02_53880 [Microvirga aerophila]